MKYFVQKTDVINPAIDSPEWDKAEIGFVDKERWTDVFFPAPKTTFKVLRGPEGISILMHTDEKNLRAEIKEENGDICEDSCMEFFLKVSPWDTRYLNFEINPKGVVHLGIGDGRFKRTLIDEDRKTFSIVSIANDGDWTLKYYIPDTFIAKWYPDLEALSSGNKSNIVKANFYKCGDSTEKPHLAMWSEIEVDEGDFHVPDFFGQLIFE